MVASPLSDGGCDEARTHARRDAARHGDDDDGRAEHHAEVQEEEELGRGSWLFLRLVFAVTFASYFCVFLLRLTFAVTFAVTLR